MPDFHSSIPDLDEMLQSLLLIEEGGTRMYQPFVRTDHDTDR